MNKGIAYFIGSLTTLIAIRALWGYSPFQGSASMIPSSFTKVIALGFPFIFVLRKDIRNVFIALCLLVMFYGGETISWGCVFITFLIWFRKSKMLTILILTVGLILPFAGPKFLRISSNPISDMRSRIELYDTTLNKWTKVWSGHYEFCRFSALPENQPENRPDKRWLHTAESDFIQGLYEFGVIRMAVIMLVLLLPLFYLKLNSPLNTAIFSGYVCMLFQSLFSFPFHRMITGILGSIIIMLAYGETYEDITSSFISMCKRNAFRLRVF